MHAWYEEPADRKESDRGRAHQRHVQIARTRTVGVERRPVAPPTPCQGTPAEDHPGSGWDVTPEEVNEGVEPLCASAKREANDVAPLLFFSEAPLLRFAGVHAP